jgi:diadenosine tetraphosphatase ApaH/serine/threonine PP2A family protein phosphatase
VDYLEASHISASEYATTLDAAINALQKEQNTGLITGGKISNKLLELDIPENLVLIGDIHGDSCALHNIFKKVRIEEYILNPNNKIVFLGDYVDRGSGSIEVLYTICSLKIRHPNSIILMRGNHEAPVEFPFSSHDLPRKMTERFGKRIGNEIYQNKIIKFFQLLYLITIIDRKLLVVHGGVPTDLNIMTSNFRKIVGHERISEAYGGIVEEILWNDPRKLIPDGKDWENSRRGLGRHFGLNISKKWLSISDTKVIVRGHEPCYGFKLDHNGRVLTLFSCNEAYPKFGIGYILISGDQLRSIRNGFDLSESVTIL